MFLLTNFGPVSLLFSLPPISPGLICTTGFSSAQRDSSSSSMPPNTQTPKRSVGQIVFFPFGSSIFFFALFISAPNSPDLSAPKYALSRSDHGEQKHFLFFRVCETSSARFKFNLPAARLPWACRRTCPGAGASSSARSRWGWTEGRAGSSRPYRRGWGRACNNAIK